MSDEKRAWTIRADYVFPVAAPPIQGGSVTICGEQISHVGLGGASQDDVKLTGFAILPGLVNPHAHLEFSDLESPLPARGGSFADWIRAVVAYRRTRTRPVDEIVQQGIAECLRSGVTTVADIATGRWKREPYVSSPAHCVVLHELLGFSPEQSDALIHAARGHLSTQSKFPYRAGLAPHAPYSLHPRVLRALVNLAGPAHPVALHLAESREEVEFLDQQSGPLRDLLESLDAWAPGVVGAGTRALDYLRVLAEAPKSLVIHGNYLEDEELDFAAENADRMSLVYCPRTHAHFGHDRYPLAGIVQRGGAVCLGTDGRASNPDLQLLEEFRFAAGQHPDVSPGLLLSMITSAPALALGLGEGTGVIRPGSPADLAIVPWPGHNAADPCELLLDESCPVVITIRGGQVVHDALGLVHSKTRRN
jgi:cytosine/adenosine deaminase-related metal-dependent hydrolase